MRYKIADEYEGIFVDVGTANTLEMAQVLADMRRTKMHGECDVVIYEKNYADGRYYVCREVKKRGK